MKFLFKRKFSVFDVACLWGLGYLTTEYGWIWLWAMLPMVVVSCFGEYVLESREMQP